ncbi:MAG: hypothetical protein Q9M13_08050 [Mariprofundales bacterium]|nr:hypothetical protein [Mariprofundales bacterium]
MNLLQRLPGVFPLHEDRDIFSERERVIFQLLCRPLSTFIGADAEELSKATGEQVDVSRCQQLIDAAEIAALPGLGMWIARVMAEAGLTADAVRNNSALSVMSAVNGHTGYRICNDATIHALEHLQREWRGML